jgi:hypothetical protein
MFAWQIDAAGNCTKFVGLHVKRPIFLSDFNQISCFSTDIHESPQYKILRESIQWTEERDEANRLFLWQHEIFFFLTFYLCFLPTNLAKAAIQYFIFRLTIRTTHPDLQNASLKKIINK